MNKHLIAVVSLLVVGVTAFQPTEAADALASLPKDPAQWVQAPPLSREFLAGKGVVLYFYEEQCPRCRDKWPGLLETAQKYEGKPVVFIAVNSGNPRPAVEGYLRQNRIVWPAIVDADRKFEQALQVPEVSLRNIVQIRTVNGRGEVSFGDWDNFDAAAEQALVGAAWRVDPQGLPPSLKQAWLALEMGNYAAAASAITSGLANRNEATKAGAQRLFEAVTKEIAARTEPAQAALQAGRKWEAYQGFQAVATRFAGYPLPDDVTKAAKELAADPQVAAEIAAAKVLELARKQLASPVAVVRKRGAETLNRLIADSPETDAARVAAELLREQ